MTTEHGQMKKNEHGREKKRGRVGHRGNQGGGGGGGWGGGVGGWGGWGVGGGGGVGGGWGDRNLCKSCGVLKSGADAGKKMKRKGPKFGGTEYKEDSERDGVKRGGPASSIQNLKGER